MSKHAFKRVKIYGGTRPRMWDEAKKRGDDVRVAFRLRPDATSVAWYTGLVCQAEQDRAFVWFGPDNRNNGFFKYADLQCVGHEEPPLLEITPSERVCHEMAKKVAALFHISKLRDYFWYPVDERDYPSYYTIITSPMTFQHILNTLKVGIYRDEADVRAHVELIWSNCRTFNSNNAAMLRITEQLERVVKTRLF